eukprot:741796-Prymnesium_polylepis.1
MQHAHTPTHAQFTRTRGDAHADARAPESTGTYCPASSPPSAIVFGSTKRDCHPPPSVGQTARCQTARRSARIAKGRGRAVPGEGARARAPHGSRVAPPPSHGPSAGPQRWAQRWPQLAVSGAVPRRLRRIAFWPRTA